jgi:hypothetical protein
VGNRAPWQRNARGIAVKWIWRVYTFVPNKIGGVTVALDIVIGSIDELCTVHPYEGVF